MPLLAAGIRRWAVRSCRTSWQKEAMLGAAVSILDGVSDGSGAGGRNMVSVGSEDFELKKWVLLVISSK